MPQNDPQRIRQKLNLTLSQPIIEAVYRESEETKAPISRIVEQAILQYFAKNHNPSETTPTKQTSNTISLHLEITEIKHQIAQILQTQNEFKQAFKTFLK